MITRSSQELRTGEANYSPALGFTNVPNKAVECAVDTLINKMAPAYLELVGEIEKLQVEPSIDTHLLTKKVPSGSISVPRDQVDKNQEIENSRCYIRQRIKIKNLQNNDGFEHLLLQLYTRIIELGYTDKAESYMKDGVFDVRLEKGCMSSTNANEWHYDGTFKTSISVCYSNRENWSTRLFTQKNMSKADLEICKRIMNGPGSGRIEDNALALSHIESEGKPSQSGVFYDALYVLHRSPKASDLECKDLDVNDYRLFIRYNEFNVRPNPQTL